MRLKQIDLLLSFCAALGLSSIDLVGHDDGGVLVLKAAKKMRTSSFSASILKEISLIMEYNKSLPLSLPPSPALLDLPLSLSLPPSLPPSLSLSRSPRPPSPLPLPASLSLSIALPLFLSRLSLYFSLSMDRFIFL